LKILKEKKAQQWQTKRSPFSCSTGLRRRISFQASGQVINHVREKKDRILTSFCPFFFDLAIVLSVLLGLTAYDYPFGIFKLLLRLYASSTVRI
jgi:hypothetical protein